MLQGPLRIFELGLFGVHVGLGELISSWGLNSFNSFNFSVSKTDLSSSCLSFSSNDRATAG